MRLRVGFAGAGYICGIHKNNLVLDERVEIVSTFDCDPSRGDAASFDETLEKSDAVYITAPNTRHVELALLAVAAGKHVFCEKPMATTLEDARRVLEAAQASGRVFQVGHNRRFSKVYSRVQQLLAASPPHTAHIKMNRGELLKPAWTADESVTGGFLFETPIHMFDMMRFQFGEVVSLDARLSRVNDFSLRADGNLRRILDDRDRRDGIAELSHRAGFGDSGGELQPAAAGRKAGFPRRRSVVCGRGSQWGRAAGDRAGWISVGGAGSSLLSKRSRRPPDHDLKLSAISRQLSVKPVLLTADSLFWRFPCRRRLVCRRRSVELALPCYRQRSGTPQDHDSKAISCQPNRFWLIADG